MFDSFNDIVKQYIKNRARLIYKFKFKNVFKSRHSACRNLIILKNTLPYTRRQIVFITNKYSDFCCYNCWAL